MSARIFLLLAMAIPLLQAGCAGAPRTPLFLDPGFAAAGVTTIVIPAVTFDPRYEPPYDIDIDGELRARLSAVLQRKGYRAIPADTGSETGARLAVHVDFLILDVQTLERNPPPSIDIEAAARLLAPGDGRELWRDRGQARSTSSFIFYPAAERQLVLSRLAERLLATLPPAGFR
jgi:hypothetical protein